MKQEYPWLDILTDCVLNLSDIRIQESSPRAWLNSVASALAEDFGHDFGIALIRVMQGPAETPWSNSFHAVQCGPPEQCDKFRSRYTSSVIAAGLQPDDFISTNRAGYECLMPTDLHLQPKMAQLAAIMAGRYGVHHFVHCRRSISASDGVEEGALVLNAWQIGPPSTTPTIPPKPILRNIMRAIALHLVRFEKIHHSQNNSELLNRLTPKQKHVAELLLQGKSEKQVAADLLRSRHTVHQHVKAIYSRLSVRSRAEFMARCIPTVSIAKNYEIVNSPKTPSMTENNK